MADGIVPHPPGFRGTASYPGVPSASSPRRWNAATIRARATVPSPGFVQGPSASAGERDAGDLQGQSPPNAELGAEQFIPGIGDPEQGFVERMWDPRVRVRGPIATVWAPYDFYIGGVFSHCGVDTLQLVKTGGEWKAQSVLYSRRQPPACPLHPEGPPAGAA